MPVIHVFAWETRAYQNRGAVYTDSLDSGPIEGTQPPLSTGEIQA